MSSRSSQERADLMSAAAREKIRSVKAVFLETRCQRMNWTLYAGRRTHEYGGNTFLFQLCTSSFIVSFVLADYIETTVKVSCSLVSPSHRWCLFYKELPLGEATSL